MTESKIDAMRAGVRVLRRGIDVLERRVDDLDPILKSCDKVTGYECGEMIACDEKGRPLTAKELNELDEKLQDAQPVEGVLTQDNLHVGDRVKVFGVQGPAMSVQVVTEHDDGWVARCFWFDRADRLHEADFILSTLTYA